jgi:methylated-DNA-[protein]-cysteine S-methyltransferase
MNQPLSEYAVIMDSPAGCLGIRLRDGYVAGLDYLPVSAALKRGSEPLARQVARELLAWFQDPQSRFSVPLEPAATSFQQKVRDALRQIPAGQTRTYGELAGRLHSGARAVGNACRHNPLPIIVPCHRVIGATGMGGYAGKTAGAELVRKRWLLHHEGIADTALKNHPPSPSRRLHPRIQRIRHA